MDHDRHMLVLNNCIGSKNRKQVIAYLSSNILLLGFIVLSTTLHYFSILPKPKNTEIKFWFKILSTCCFSISVIVLLFVIYSLIKYSRAELKTRKRHKLAQYMNARQEAMSEPGCSQSIRSSKISFIDMEKQFEKNLKVGNVVKNTSSKYKTGTTKRKQKKTTIRRLKIGPAHTDHLDSSDDSDDDVEILRLGNDPSS